MGADLGDFQTPVELVEKVLGCIGPVGDRWARVLEPTCGSGGFIRGLIDSGSPPEEIIGIELQERHLEEARRIAQEGHRTSVEIKRANLFDIDLSRDLGWRSRGRLLVLGNPPWVTSSRLGAMGSRNLPAKSNIKGLGGLDAVTGSSNFDLAEFIWLKLIREIGDERPTIALLSKTSAARNVLQFAHDRRVPVAAAWMRRLDARRYFKASVDACLFYLEIGEGEGRFEAPVFEDFESSQPESTLGFAAGRMVFDLGRYRKAARLDGACQLVWRQGVKHDAARVIELSREGGRFVNGIFEAVDVEPDFIFPLLKSSDLNREPHMPPRLHVIITQRRLGEETAFLQEAAPRLWSYLSAHSAHFERRKSSIYRGRPPFAMFGIGGYSFSPFKVAVSGLHKRPRFRLVHPAGGRPVMLDDTCYFIACDSARQAALVTALLNHRAAAEFLGSLIFVDSKRPVTKRLLERIDLLEALSLVAKREIIAHAEKLLDQIPKNEVGSKGGWPDDLGSLLSPL